jgi:hypothetical protein
MASGGSRLLYLSNCGLSPMEGINLLQSEQIMDIDKLFVPIQTSFTQSSKTGNTGGRPDAETMKSEGKSVSEITDQVNDGK